MLTHFTQILTKIGKSAEEITDHCNQVSHAVQTAVAQDRECLQAELNAVDEVHKVHWLKLKQQYTTQLDKLVRFIESNHVIEDAENSNKEELEEVVSIIFEYHESKGSTLSFEDAVQHRERDITIPADEYLGMRNELQRLRQREKVMEELLLQQQQVINENKHELNMFKLDVKGYKKDEKDKQTEMLAIKAAFEDLENDKAAQVETFEQTVEELLGKEKLLKAGIHHAKNNANMMKEALDLAQRQLAKKDETIECLTRNLKLHQGLNLSTSGGRMVHCSSPSDSEQQSKIPIRVTPPGPRVHGFPRYEVVDGENEDPAQSFDNLSQVSTNSAAWIASSRPRAATSLRRHGRQLTILTGERLRERYKAAADLSSLRTATPTSSTPSVRKPFDLNKELPTPPAGALRFDMAARGSSTAKEMGKAAEEGVDNVDSGSNSDSDGENRVRALASEFPELVRFKAQDLLNYEGER
jgi:hypothetical protein